jgi:hypothetical protein
MIKIRAYKAIDEPESCLKYAEGHRKVLEMYGVTKVTSANLSWTQNPHVYVIQAESSSDRRVLGGARIHLPFNGEFLPIEEAVSELDDKIFPMIKEYAKDGTGEICGLWNSKEVAGMGIGTLFLMRAGISLTRQLSLGSLFALCAQHTLKISTSKGFEIERSLGNNGTFYYPKEDLLASAIIIKDPEILKVAETYEKEYIFNLRKNPSQKRIEKSNEIPFEIDFDLIIKGLK